MRIAIVGVGHVGLVSAAAFARWGHDVIGLDDDTAKVATLREGRAWFYEPGLQDLLDEVITAGRLTFTSDPSEAITGAEAVFACVGTPALEDGSPNLAYLEAVAGTVAAHASADVLLVEKSTVPASTGRRLEQVIARELSRLGKSLRIEVASNPEFLREGTAVEDTLHPDRVVYGTSSDWARDVLRGVYAPLVAADGCPVVETDVATSEVIKHASNAFLATRISFINAVARICEQVGADVNVVADGMGHDARIGRSFLSAGLGYGGSCFPKDVDAFAHLARQVGVPFRLLDEVRAINVSQRRLIVDKLRQELWHLDGKTVVLLGAAFKPGTDDLREAPAMYLARELAAAARTSASTTRSRPLRSRRSSPMCRRTTTSARALAGAHAAVVCTEWDEVRALTPQDYLAGLAYPIVVDGRNAHDPEVMLGAGLRYHSIGRRSADRQDA
jgi:UDPglucose 6-dehydrogenase